jgi:hypothetical protein
LQNILIAISSKIWGKTRFGWGYLGEGLASHSDTGKLQTLRSMAGHDSYRSRLNAGSDEARRGLRHEVAQAFGKAKTRGPRPNARMAEPIVCGQSEGRQQFLQLDGTLNIRFQPEKIAYVRRKEEEELAEYSPAVARVEKRTEFAEDAPGVDSYDLDVVRSSPSHSSRFVRRNSEELLDGGIQHDGCCTASV